MTEPQKGAWLGDRPTTVQIVVMLFIGTAGVLVAGVQPILLGSLLGAGHITAPQLGYAATLELFTLALGVVLGEILLEGRSLRLVAFLATVVLALANLATPFVHGDMVTLMRGVAGLPGGVLVWMTTAMVVRSPRPTRWSAIYLMCQASVQCAVAAGVGAYALGRVDAVPTVIAAFAAIAAALTFALPRRFAALPKEPTISGLPPARGIAALAVIMLTMAAIVGAWVYVEPLGKAAGLSATQIATATPLSLGSQLLGGGLAILLAGRVAWFRALSVSILLLAANLFWLSALPSPFHFLALEAVFGCLWVFIGPFFTPFAIDNDGTRRTAVLAPSAMLFGSAVGPFVASAFVGEGDAAGVVRICGSLAVVAVLLIFGLHVTRPAGKSAPGGRSG